MSSLETSPRKKIFFPYKDEPQTVSVVRNTAFVFDPPDPEGFGAQALFDVVEATMTSTTEDAQVSEVHDRVSLNDREAYWLMLRLQEHFTSRPVEDVADLRAEFKPYEEADRKVAETPDRKAICLARFVRDVARAVDLTNHPDLARRLHWALDDAGNAVADALDLESKKGEKRGEEDEA